MLSKLTQPDKSTSITTKLFTPLNTGDIEQLLDTHDWDNNVVVTPFNCVPLTSVKSYPYAYICNTDDNQSPGTHWFTLLFPSENALEIFDSFAECHQDMMEKFPSRTTLVNTRVLQHLLTSTCGYYCVMFLHHRLNLGLSMEEFVTQFDAKDLLGNDIKVARMIQ